MFNKGNYNMGKESFQDQLIDVSCMGKERPWREKKIRSLLLSELYRGIDDNKSIRLHGCATFICFLVDALGQKRLDTANFCRVRLCPMCTWRRSLKIFSQVKCVMDKIQEENDYSYLFLTLTVKNCVGDELSKRLDELFYAWNKFSKNKKFKGVVVGWYRGLEVTHNVRENTYHPHFHCILVVKKFYFTSRDYLTQVVWTSMWKKALGVDYTPMVNIKKVYGVTAKSVAEVAKYSVKDKDYIKPEDWELSKEIVTCLDGALAGRRLMAFGGIFKEVHKRLALDDAVEGDLVHVSRDKLGREEDEGYLSYVWNVGYQQYRLAE